jgi:hypothetical protein
LPSPEAEKNKNPARYFVQDVSNDHLEQHLKNKYPISAGRWAITTYIVSRYGAYSFNKIKIHTNQDTY